MIPRRSKEWSFRCVLWGSLTSACAFVPLNLNVAGNPCTGPSGSCLAKGQESATGGQSRHDMVSVSPAVSALYSHQLEWRTDPGNAARLTGTPLNSVPRERAVEPAAPLANQLSGESSDPTPKAMQEESQVDAPVLVPNRPEIKRLVKELTGRGRHAFADALRMGKRQLPMIKKILKNAGLPTELAYLPMVESRFRHDAQSSEGAVGMWQFMKNTARASGLRVDQWVDERLDPEMSTRAAARHLKTLHQRFGDWDLVLAAYNAGIRAVMRALKRSNSEGFWDPAFRRRLPAETRRYVPKFYAVLHVVQNLAAREAGDGAPAVFGFDPSATERFTISAR
jgi:soluble lytic murein transglycosylase-like protein